MREDEEDDEELETEEKDTREDSGKIITRRHSARFDLPDAEEAKPLKGKKSKIIITLVRITCFHFCLVLIFVCRNHFIALFSIITLSDVHLESYKFKRGYYGEETYLLDSAYYI